MMPVYKYNIIIIGPLQVAFLSGATGYCIQQYCEIKYASGYAYDLLVTPCCSIDYMMINIMWVRFTLTSLCVNHIIPLVYESRKESTISFIIKIYI